MIAVTPNLRSIVDHDGAVILDITRDSMTTVDTTGAYIWDRLGRNMTVDAIVAELVRETGADPETVAKDMDEFLEQLKSRHLVFQTSERHPGRGAFVDGPRTLPFGSYPSRIAEAPCGGYRRDLPLG